MLSQTGRGNRRHSAGSTVDGIGIALCADSTRVEKNFLMEKLSKKKEENKALLAQLPFTDGETEAQRGKEVTQYHTASQPGSPDSQTNAAGLEASALESAYQTLIKPQFPHLWNED